MSDSGSSGWVSQVCTPISHSLGPRYPNPCTNLSNRVAKSGCSLRSRSSRPSSPLSKAAVRPASARTTRDRSHSANDGSAESTSPAWPISRIMSVGSSFPTSEPHMIRCSGAAVRARVMRTSFEAERRSGRSARTRSASSRSSSSSGNVVVVSVHCTRSATLDDSSSLTSPGFGRCGGGFGWEKKAASIASAPMPARIPVMRTYVWLTYR